MVNLDYFLNCLDTVYMLGRWIIFCICCEIDVIVHKN
jgi:hypothetical protein